VAEGHKPVSDPGALVGNMKKMLLFEQLPRPLVFQRLSIIKRNSVWQKYTIFFKGLILKEGTLVWKRLYSLKVGALFVKNAFHGQNVSSTFSLETIIYLLLLSAPYTPFAYLQSSRGI